MRNRGFHCAAESTETVRLIRSLEKKRGFEINFKNIFRKTFNVYVLRLRSEGVLGFFSPYRGWFRTRQFARPDENVFRQNARRGRLTITSFGGGLNPQNHPLGTPPDNDIRWIAVGFRLSVNANVRHFDSCRVFFLKPSSTNTETFRGRSTRWTICFWKPVMFLLD